MFGAVKRKTTDIAALTRQIIEKSEECKSLQARISELEKSRHQFVEQCRYVIEAAATGLPVEARTTLEIKGLANGLPYLLTGTRHWNGPDLSGSDEAARENATQLAETYGFVLPASRTAAAQAMLDLAQMLFCPAMAVPVENLRMRYPLPGERNVKQA